MASANKTAHINLSQWEPEDHVLREDFNADNKKVDDKAKALDQRIDYLTPVTGTYLGTGISVTQTITLGFRPSAVLVMSNGGSISGGNNTDYGLALGNQDGKILKLTATGFTVTSEGLNTYPGTGQSYVTDKNPFRYIAWR